MCFELFNYISDVDFTYGIGSLIIYAQIFLSICLQVKFLFDCLKNKPIGVKYLIMVTPVYVTVVYSFQLGIGFGGFFSSRWTIDSLLYLVSITLTEQGVYEIVAISALFIILTVAYSVIYRMKLLPWLLTFGFESIVSLALLILYGGLFFKEFPFTIFELCSTEINLVRFLIYGLFVIILKDFLLVVSLIVGALFRERKKNRDDDEEMYFDRKGFYEKQALKYFTRDHLPIMISILIFGILTEGFAGWITYMVINEDPTNITNILMGFVVGGLFALMFGIPVVMVCRFVYRLGQPKNMPAYIQLCAMENKDIVFCQFYDEIVKGTPTVRKTGANIFSQMLFNESETISPHFVIQRKGIMVTGVKWRGYPLDNHRLHM